MDEEIKRILWEQQERKKKDRSKEIEDIVMKEVMRGVELQRIDLKFDPRWVSEIKDSLPNGIEEKLITWAIESRTKILRITCNRFFSKLMPIEKAKMDLLNKVREEFNQDVSAILGNPYFKSYLLLKAIDLGISVPDPLLLDRSQWGVIRGCSIDYEYEFE